VVGAEYFDASALDAGKVENRLQHGRFAGAVDSDQADRLAGRDFKIEPPQHLAGSIPLGDLGKQQRWGHHIARFNPYR